MTIAQAGDTKIIAPISVANDSTAAVRAASVLGGYVAVVDTTERDAIPTSSRKQGMLVRINAGTIYVLGAGLTNGDWSTVSLGVTAHSALTGLTTGNDHTQYVLLDGTTPLTGNWSIGSNLISSSGTPSTANHLANKAYVDSVSAGLRPKAEVRAVATTNVTRSGAQTVDGISLNINDRVLLTGQSTPSQNGISVVQSGAWTRPTDFATGAAASGAFMSVDQGTTNHDTWWFCTTDSGSDVIDTNDLAFVEFAQPGVITAGNGLTKVGTQISAVAADATISVTFSGLSVASASLSDTHIASAAAIAGSKIAPDFGAQTVQTTGGYLGTGAASFIRFGLASGSGAGVASAASTGSIRWPRGGTDLAALYGRIDTDLGDVRLLQWLSASSGTLNISQASGVTAVNCHVASAGTFTVLVGGNGRFQVVNLSANFIVPTISFDNVMASATIAQLTSATNSATGAPMVMHAQDCSGTTSIGGAFTLRPGSGTSTGGELALATGGNTKRVRIDDTGIGFFNTAPTAKATITGSRGGNAALASLLTELAAKGLLIDSSS